jgi:prepilin-type N-terminal cleavage/methylation domain-containing protein
VTARRGFTLLEVLVALVVSALVITLAYGAAQAGFDTEARLRERAAAAEARTAWRALLGDALRHVERGVAEDDVVFDLAPAREGRGSDTLRLATRGIVPPLGTGDRWAVTLAPTRDGVLLSAAPAEGAAGVPVTVRVREARGLRVLVLPHAGGAWTREWTRGAAAPAAVSVQLVDSVGRAVEPPLIARTRPAGAMEAAP